MAQLGELFNEYRLRRDLVKSILVNQGYRKQDLDQMRFQDLRQLAAKEMEFPGLTKGSSGNS